jgi:hypothetical protein
MSGTGFTAVDYELFVQKSDAATNFTVEPAQTKQTNHIHQLRTRFEVLLKSSTLQVSWHKDACNADANERK